MRYKLQHGLQRRVNIPAFKNINPSKVIGLCIFGLKVAYGIAFPSLILDCLLEVAAVREGMITVSKYISCLLFAKGKK